jgi:putative adenylate-forming enzyme
MKHRFQKLDFKKWQDRQVKDLVKYAYLRSPFYHKLYKDFDINKWHGLPIIDRKIMMDNFDNFNTQGISKNDVLASTLEFKKNGTDKLKYKNISISLSSGALEQQAIFLANSFEESQWVGAFLAKAIPPSFGPSHKIAFFMRPSSAISEGLKIKKIQFRYFDLIKSVHEQIKELEKYRPTILVAPPSILRIIAFYKRELRLRLLPKRIYAIAEVLEPIDQDYIEGIFEQKLHQIYQAAEGFLGVTCSKNIMHLNEDLFVIEEEDLGLGRFMPIITNLFCEVQPLIRYRLEDVLIRGERNCACGSYYRTVEKIECRKEDVLIFYDVLKSKRIPLYPDYIGQTLVKVSDQIEEYRVTQEFANQLKLQLKLANDTDLQFLELRIRKYFNELFTRFNIAPIEIEIQISYGFKKDLPFTKVKRVARLFQPEP